jgi:hypothetical protein
VEQNLVGGVHVATAGAERQQLELEADVYVDQWPRGPALLQGLRAAEAVA